MNHHNSQVGRRQFLKKGLAGAAGFGVLTLSGQASVARDASQTEEKKGTFPARVLGRTGIRLPIVSMGVMNSDNENLVRAALDAGLIHLDTAHVYQRGRNEEMIGRVLKGRPRDSFVIATKVLGEPRDRRTGLFSAETKAEPFLQKFDLSLQRLGLDHVDILYLHNVQYRDSVLFEPLLKALETIKKSGKARFVGVSTHGNMSEVLNVAAESGFYDVVLTSYNFRDQNLEALEKAIARAAEAGLGVVAMKTQAGVYWDREKTEPINMKAALKWALRNPHIATAIPGMTAFDQLSLNLEVLSDPAMTPEDWESLHLERKVGGLYCQQCQTCLSQCPAGLPLPSIMRSYMYAYGYGNLGAAHDLLSSLELPDALCADCGECRVTCSQQFDVKSRVTDIARLLRTPREFFA
ncbi:MAG: aldo/keto reductase [Candidatus Aminicenantes bacterium]|nr:aldo/keto reductase [Candidatus Aminicenantes bacterium]